MRGFCCSISHDCWVSFQCSSSFLHRVKKLGQLCFHFHFVGGVTCISPFLWRLCWCFPQGIVYNYCVYWHWQMFRRCNLTKAFSTRIVPTIKTCFIHTHDIKIHIIFQAFRRCNYSVLRYVNIIISFGLLVKSFDHFAGDLFGSYSMDFNGVLWIWIKAVQSPELTGVVSEQYQEVLGIWFSQNLCKFQNVD